MFGDLVRAPQKRRFPLRYKMADVLSAYTRDTSFTVFLVWAFVSMRNRSNWEMTSIHGYRNVLRLLTIFAVEPGYFMRFSKNAKSTIHGNTFAGLTDKQRVFVVAAKVGVKARPNNIKLTFKRGKVMTFEIPKRLRLLRRTRMQIRAGNRFAFANCRALYQAVSHFPSAS